MNYLEESLRFAAKKHWSQSLEYAKKDAVSRGINPCLITFDTWKERAQNLLGRMRVEGIQLGIDGNMICAKGRDFIDLQQSCIGFGETPEEAISNLYLMQELDKTPIADNLEKTRVGMEAVRTAAYGDALAKLKKMERALRTIALGRQGDGEGGIIEA